MEEKSNKFSDFFDRLWCEASFMTEILASLLWCGIIASYFGSTIYIVILAFLSQANSLLESFLFALAAPFIATIATPIGYVFSLPALVLIGPPLTLLLIKLGQFTQIKMAILSSAIAFTYSLLWGENHILALLSPAFLISGFLTGWLAWKELHKKEI